MEDANCEIEDLKDEIEEVRKDFLCEKEVNQELQKQLEKAKQELNLLRMSSKTLQRKD